MTELVVRRLLIDLAAPIPARWNGGDAFRSAFFNALSMSFPVGEQYFIDSVRAGLKTLPDAARAKYEQEVRGFIGQEATHRRIHSLFNAHLDKLDFPNIIEKRALRRLEKNAHLDVRLHLAATAATEHFTAILANWMLRHPFALQGSEDRLKTMWLWHSAEESEHRCTAYDIYQAAGGDYPRRIKVFRYITMIFMTDVLYQTMRNLWHDGALFKLSTWRSACRFLFGKDGIISANRQAWRDYLAADFHPDQHDASLSRQWLADNAGQFAVVG